MQELAQIGGWFVAGVATAIQIYRNLPQKKRQILLDGLYDALKDGKIEKDEIKNILDDFVDTEETETEGKGKVD